MVRVGDMLKKKKSLGLGQKEEEALAMFRTHATPTPLDGKPNAGPPGVNFKVFRQLMKALVRWANEEAIKNSVRNNTILQSQFPIPSRRDLRAAFKIADADKSGYVDEEEFMNLFATVIAGKVRGLGGGIDFYRSPYQHMQWGDEDFHPDTDWQDLFFDLLFAGSAFCGAALLAESLVNGQAAEGFAWFVVMFLCLAQQWVMRVQYCSRFASTSLFHAIFVEELEFLCIALATWHIPLGNATKESSSYAFGSRRELLAGGDYEGGDGLLVFTPVDQLRANIDSCVFGFSFFLGCNSLIYVGRWAEILFDPNASYGAKCIARFNTKTNAVVSFVFFSAAVMCYMLSGGTDDDYEDESAAWCLAVWAVAHLTFIGCLAHWTKTMGNKLEVQARAESVPMSVGYLIVRVGEWTMVMLGETVLSLLGVPLKSDVMVYGMFVCSMLIAGNLQFQGYTVHPIHADHHVLHGGQFSFKGLLYLIWATIWYATILVCVGTGAKVLTKKATYYDVYVAANWVFCGGLAAAFISIMVFDSLHHREDHKALGIFDCFTSNRVGKGAASSCFGDEAISMKAARVDVIKAITVGLHLMFAILEFKPHHIVFFAYFVVLVQSGIIIYEHSGGVDSDHDHDHDELHSEYHRGPSGGGNGQKDQSGETDTVLSLPTTVGGGNSQEEEKAGEKDYDDSEKTRPLAEKMESGPRQEELTKPKPSPRPPPKKKTPKATESGEAPPVDLAGENPSSTSSASSTESKKRSQRTPSTSDSSPETSVRTPRFGKGPGGSSKRAPPPARSSQTYEETDIN